MASFQKRGKTWQYTISRYVQGKLKPLRKGGFKTKKEAQVAAAEQEEKLRKGFAPTTTQILFAEYFNSWLDTFKTDISNNTLERYKNTLETINKEFEGVYIQDITRRSYQSFLNEYGKDHAKSTTRKLNTHIRACVAEAIDEGLIYRDFTRKAVFTGTNAKKPEEKYLNLFESKKLLRALIQNLDKTNTYYLLLLALTSGLRYAELVGLTRKDFDFKNNVIKVNKTWGYTNKMSEGFGETKNEQSIRTVPVDKKTMDLFNKWFADTPDNITQLVFYSPQSKYKVISNAVANKVLKGILEKLDCKVISVHGLRHTYASLLLYGNVSIYTVAKRLGHSDINTTQNTYTHIIKELEEKDQDLSAQIFMKMYV